MIIAGTMATVGTFVSMLFVSGIMGQYLSIIPKTLIATLSSSLFVALVIIPTLSIRFIKIKKDNEDSYRTKRRHLFIKSKVKKLQEKYRGLLSKILSSNKKRRVLITSAWVAFLIAVAIPAIGIMKIQMFPVADFDYFVVNIELPTGSTLESTNKITANVEKIVANIPELKNYVVNIGSSGSNLSSIMVNLVNSDKREKQSYEISKSIRNNLDKIQGTVVTTEDLSAGPPSGSPVEVRVFGTETGKIVTTAEKITKYFKKLRALLMWTTPLRTLQENLTSVLINKKPANYDLSVASIAKTLRNAVYGTKATTVNINDTDIGITIKYDKANFTRTNDLENILLQTPNGDSIPLKQITDLNLEPALLQIKHRNGKKLITVTADTDPETNLRKITANFKKFKDTIDIPDGYSIKIGRETEDIQ